MHRPTIPKRFVSLRRPEYTGANRCLPCTVVNLCIAAVLTAGAAVVSAPLAVAVAFVSLSAVYLRGYLVPGTPELTKRYLPNSVLRLFGKDERARPLADAPASGPAEPVDVTAALLGLGVLVERPEDVALAPDFERAWRAAMAERDAHAPDMGDLGDVLGVDPGELSPYYYGDDACTVYRDDVPVGHWESAAAFCADTAAAATLAGEDDWERLPFSVRGELLAALRACLERCPVCEGAVELGAETVESCCTSREVVAAACVDCGARLFEADYDDAMAA
jgi:hypothetical protein